MKLNLMMAAEAANTWGWSWWVLFALLGGLIAGFFIARAVFKNELKKNPPVNRNMIRAMFISMGRKPSEAQINQVMNSMNSAR